jgi:DNA invertase Pin-like site-specific DNA recombinase
MKYSMPKPHPFATAPATKGRARAVPKPAVTVHGYARVSTGGQSVDAQARQLRAAGAGKVFREVASGVAVDRPQLRRLLSELAAGDVVMVTRLDRLARSTRDLLNTLAAITEKKAGFRSLGDAWADTTTAHGRLMLTVLGGLTEFERELIRTPHRRGSGARQGGRQKSRPKTQAHPARERRGHSPARRGRVSPGDRARLQCQRQYDFPTYGMNAMYQTPTRGDFQRNLSDIIHKAQARFKAQKGKITNSLVASQGSGSGALISRIVTCADDLHSDTIEKSARLIHEFTACSQMTPDELGAAARPMLQNLEIQWLAPLLTNQYPQPQGQLAAEKYSLVFRQRLEKALRDIQIGFIGGRKIVSAAAVSAPAPEPPTPALSDAISLRPGLWGVNIDLLRVWGWLRGKWRAKGR